VFVAVVVMGQVQKRGAGRVPENQALDAPAHPLVVEAVLGVEVPGNGGRGEHYVRVVVNVGGAAEGGPANGRRHTPSSIEERGSTHITHVVVGALRVKVDAVLVVEKARRSRRTLVEKIL
jgi:hypothetical protein